MGLCRLVVSVVDSSLEILQLKEFVQQCESKLGPIGQQYFAFWPAVMVKHQFKDVGWLELRAIAQRRRSLSLQDIFDIQIKEFKDSIIVVEQVDFPIKMKKWRGEDWAVKIQSPAYIRYNARLIRHGY